jgi:hypothetical protein
MVRAMVRAAFACAAAVALVVVAVSFAPGCDDGHSADPVCLRLADGGWDNDLSGTDLGANAGLCYFPAPAAAARTACSAELTHGCDTSGTSAPNLACLGATVPADGGVADVEGATLTGFIHAWQNGPDTTSFQVTVFDANQLATGVDPGSVPPLGQMTFALEPYQPGDTPQRRACDTDPAVGCAPALSTCTGCADGYYAEPDRGQYCRADGVCASRQRWEVRYTVPAIPTDRPLVLRVLPTRNINGSSWVTTYEWNVFASPRDHACSGPGDNDCYTPAVAASGDALGVPAVYQHDVTVLSTTDVAQLANATGRPGGNRAGLGMVLGEVRDCDGVRIANAQVSLSPAPGNRYYFTGDERSARPDPRRAMVGTEQLGQFLAFDQPPGKTSIEAVGGLGADNVLTRLGRHDLVVYANSATFLYINGGRGTR